jgi:hypothetical protein
LLAKCTLKFSENINLFESTAAISNGKMADTGAKELHLIHMYMNSDLIFDCVRIGCTNTHTFVQNNCDQTSYKLIITLT